MDLKDESLDVLIGDLLNKFKVPAHMITLEVTETSMMHDPASSLKVLSR